MTLILTRDKYIATNWGELAKADNYRIIIELYYFVIELSLIYVNIFIKFRGFRPKHTDNTHISAYQQDDSPRG